MPSRHFAALFSAALLFGAAAAHAQYPARPIRWIVPYTSAGITDSITRLVTLKLEASLGQPIVVENRAGANSIVGADSVARSFVPVTVVGAAPEQAARFLDDEIAKWARVINAANVKVEQ